MPYNLTPRGPFETAQQAFDAAAPLREAVHAIDPHDRLAGDLRARWIDTRAHYVISILTACGVELGAQDERTARWIAATLDQPETAVILDWILRAHQGAPQVEDEQPVLHWPAHGLRTTTLCQGEPLTAADFADTEADATCPQCRALLEAEGTR